MAERIIVRGDSYGIRRPLYRIELLDRNGEPFDLSGCTLRTTYKTTPTSPAEDPEDTNAPIRHTLMITEDGIIATQNGLYLIGLPAGGVVEERLTADESRQLPINQPLLSDIELTDINGEVFTWIMSETLKAVDGYTNRKGY